MIHIGSIARSTPARMLATAVGIGLFTYVMLLATATTAVAYTLLGCAYDSGSISPITYRFFSISDSDIETGFVEAEVDWDLTSAPGYFDECSICLDPEINVTDDYYEDNNYAQVAYSCDGDDTFSGNEVNMQFNTKYDLDEDENQVIAMHEMGHAYGLDHVTGSCHAMTVPIRWTCGDRPSFDDVNGVDYIY
ncbi:MAG: matrixin family metalloprotease [SAR202 cluster bacterium]|jgi:hypothetical protein|nr:matrixin family metalloprotease [SAR202 cluster bacterium]